MIPVLAYMFAVVVLGLVGCTGEDSVRGRVTGQHTDAGGATGISLVRYTGYDSNGSQTYASAQPMAATLDLGDVPLSTTMMSVEYYTSNEEEMQHFDAAVSFGDGVASIAPQYSRTLFLPKRVAIVDKDDVTGNLLVRGNLPLVKGQCYPGEDRCFAYDDLNSRVKDLTKDFIPAFNLDDYEVIEFVLHDNVGNKAELTVEMKALGLDLTDVQCGANWPPYQNCTPDPKKLYTAVTAAKKPWGLVWFPMYACSRIPCNDTDTDVALNLFDFKEASAYLRQLLTTAAGSGKKRLIYFHCIQGADRTGSLHVMYMLDRHQDLALADAADRAWKGEMEGSTNPQLDYLHDDVRPMCTYIGQAYRYCQTIPGTAGRCEPPNGWKETTICKNPPG